MIVLNWNLADSNLNGRDSADYIFAVQGVDSCILRVERLDDATDTSVQYTTYTAKTTPTQYSFSGGTLTYVDLTASTESYELELGSDGYYHLGSVTGPIVYVNLDYNKYISFDDMINGFGSGGGTSFKYISEDRSVAEDYTECMIQYIACRDAAKNVYPLTEDLMYMIRNGGKYKGWWEPTNDAYRFSSVENINLEIAWMFACCYVQ